MSNICVPWLIYVCRDSFMYAIVLWHDSIIPRKCSTGNGRLANLTFKRWAALVCHDSFMCAVTHVCCDMTHVKGGSLFAGLIHVCWTYLTWLTHVYLTYLIWLIHVCFAWVMQKADSFSAFSTSWVHKIALYIPWKGPAHSAEEPCIFRKSALYIPQKSPVHSTKEPCIFRRSAPRCCEGHFWGIHKALLWNVQGSFAEYTGHFWCLAATRICVIVFLSVCLHAHERICIHKLQLSCVYTNCNCCVSTCTNCNFHTGNLRYCVFFACK